MLLVCGVWYAVPIWDTDFWWHIASGRHILQEGQLPSVDPFGVFPSTDLIRNDTVLKGQWLGQIVLYSLFDTLGVNGIIAFRVSILLFCLGLIYCRGRLLAINPLVLWPLLGLAGLGLYGFGGERPQLLSFLFAALFFLAIDLSERRDTRWLFALPVISLLWANSHGGVILGLVLLTLLSTTKWLNKDVTPHQRLTWTIITIGVFVTTLLTPNGLQTYTYILHLEGSTLQERTSEYISALHLFQLGFWWSQIWIYTYFILAVIALIGLLKQRLWPCALLILFLAAISASSIRYYAFFLIIGTPYLMQGIATMIRTSIRTDYIVHGLTSFILLAVLLTGLVREVPLQGGNINSRFPVGIVNFMQREDLRGKAFNSYEWGGYLLWQLNPQIDLFIDGRLLDGQRFPPYTHILWATPLGIELFKQEKFDLVIIPHHSRFNSKRYTLIDYLVGQPGWRLAYRDHQGVVFIHHAEQNQSHD